MTHADLVVVAMSCNGRPACWRRFVDADGLTYAQQERALDALQVAGLVALAPYPGRGPNHPEGIYHSDYICLTDAGRARAASLTDSHA